MPTQNFVVLAQQSRSGDHTSSSRQIPPSVTYVLITANIALADKLSTGLTMELEVQRSADNGVTWSDGIGSNPPPVCGIGWTSYGPGGYTGKSGVANPDPSVGFNPQVFIGQLFRAVVHIPQPLTLGCTISVTT